MPNKILALYPTFFSPKYTTCTVTNGGFIKYAGFQKVLFNTHDHVELIHQNGSSFAIPFTTKDSIDYIKMHIHIPTRETHQQLNYRHVSLQPVPITHKSIYASPLLSLILHLKYNHHSIALLQNMINKGVITESGLHCKLAPLPGRFPICDASGSTKLSRGPPTDTKDLPVGTRWHIDFAFFNITSCRGFTSVLTIVEATTRYLWFLPCYHKISPIDLCLFSFHHIRRQWLPVHQIRSDEDGALISNPEFCTLMYTYLGTVLQSTGGYASNINGFVEAPDRTIKKSTRAELMGSVSADTLWFFAGRYCALT